MYEDIVELETVTRCIIVRVFQKKKHFFQGNEKYSPPSISLGVTLKGYKRIFDFDNV